jgi:hypothetical protein
MGASAEAAHDLVACRRCATARKIAGRSPIGLTTTHGRAAARHGGKRWKLHPRGMDPEEGRGN